MATKLSIQNANYQNKPFHPHITVAFRDLKKSIYFEAWEYYQHKMLKEEFMIKQATLLKHNGRFWEQDIDFQMSN